MSEFGTPSENSRGLKGQALDFMRALGNQIVLLAGATEKTDDALRAFVKKARLRNFLAQHEGLIASARSLSGRTTTHIRSSMGRFAGEAPSYLNQPGQENLHKLVSVTHMLCNTAFRTGLDNVLAGRDFPIDPAIVETHFD